MAGLNPSMAIQRVRKDTNRENTAFPTDDDIIRWLSEGEQRFYAHINNHVRRWHVEEYEFQRDSTTRTYSLPEDYGGYFLYLEYFGGSGKPDTLNLITRREFNFDTGAVPDHFEIYTGRQELLLDPMPDVSDSNNTMRFGYQREPQNKHIGTAQANQSTKITLASQPAAGNARNYDSAYVNERIRVTAGTGAGQEAKIKAFDASTFEASLNKTLSTAVSTDSKYQLIFNVSKADEEAVVAHAKMKSQQKDNVPDAIERNEVRSMRQEAVERYKDRGFGRWRGRKHI